MNNLEAVNTLLRIIGQVPVAIIPSNVLSDAAIAQEILIEYAEELQFEGYTFNTVREVILTPDVAGNLTVLPRASDYRVLTVRPYYTHRRVALQPDGKLLDLDNNSLVFNQPLTVDIVYSVKFEFLPPALQRYVIIRAGRVFANRMVGAQEQNAYNGEDEARARSAWLQQVAYDDDLNVFSSVSSHRMPSFTSNSITNRGY